MFRSSGTDKEAHVIIARVAIRRDPDFFDRFSGGTVIGTGTFDRGVVGGEGGRSVAETRNEGSEGFFDSSFTGQISSNSGSGGRDGGCVGLWHFIMERETNR